MYKEADPQKRADYCEQISRIERSSIIYIDESGIDVNSKKDKGWAMKGDRLYDKKSGKHYERINVISGLRVKSPVAPLMFTGPCNGSVFNQWIEECMIPELRPGDTLVLDNASFHKSTRTRELIESAGCRLLYLPPYSPDLNPIENFWANMKTHIKNNPDSSLKLNQKITQFFVSKSA